MRKVLIPSLAFTTLLLAGCSADRIPFVHRIDVQQGNVITQEMLDRLEPGMDRQRVLFTLGTPLLVSTFREDRWDYVYRFQPGRGDAEQRRVTLFFEDDRLLRIDGDVRTASDARPEPVSRGPVSLTVPLEPTEKPGVIQRIRDGVTGG